MCKQDEFAVRNFTKIDYAGEVISGGCVNPDGAA